MEIEKQNQQNEQIKKDDEIDHNLYSRQIGAFGVETMSRLIKMRVLILGLSGVGLETAKNLILSGPKKVFVWDNKKCVERDLESLYYISQKNIEQGQTRSQAMIGNLKDLNSYVLVDEFQTQNLNDFLNPNIYQDFDLVIVTEFYPMEFVCQLNDVLRNLNKGMIMTATAGLFGFTFTDFGNEHKIFDKNGEPKKHVLISRISKTGQITTEENKRHDLEQGDLVKFHEVVGLEQMNEKVYEVLDIISPYCFKIEPLNFEGEYQRNGYIEEEKKIISMSFKSLREVLEQPLPDMIDCDMDFENFDRVPQLKVLLKVLWKYFSENQNWEFYSDSSKFIENFTTALNHEISLFEQVLNKDNEEKISKADWKNILNTLIPQLTYFLAPGQYSPVHSFWGGIAAQEAVKLTGKFTPINHLFIHEFYTNLFKNKTLQDLQDQQQSVQKFKDSRYLSHYALFGEKLFEEFRNKKVLMVGAGALGCEYLKMFALMGLSSNNGHFLVVDDDQIEVSNLNRQFLFRSQHVGQSKAATACNVVIGFNQQYKVEAKIGRMQVENENQFTDQYWDSIDFVVNAVDNIHARKYIDKKCVIHKKPLFESGTLGTKCNSQLILPNQTECYSDSQDPEEKGIPLCTMRSFPYMIDHCIEWSRSKFYDLFVNPSQLLNEFSQDPEKAYETHSKKMTHDLPDLIKQSEFLVFYLHLLGNPSLKEYINFAVYLYQEYFDTKISELLSLFPPDYVDKDGKLFWTSPKRPPIAIPFDKENQDHQKFILITIKILHSIVPLQESCDDQKVIEHLKNAKFTRKKGQVKEKREDIVNEQQNQPQVSSEDENKIKVLFTELKLFFTNNKCNVNEIEFEKDDDSNGHIDFISLYANFRAINYSIATAKRHIIKLKAGRITPAIATATAMVCGSVGIEIYKQMFQIPILQARNYFSNLAIPIFAFSEPNPPLTQKDKDYDVILMGPLKTIPKNWNTWSRLEVDGGKTIQQVIDTIYQEHKFTISSVICNESQIYINFIKKTEYRLQQKVEDILEDIGRKRYDGKKYEILNVSGEDDDGNDIYCPYLLYHLK